MKSREIVGNVLTSDDRALVFERCPVLLTDGPLTLRLVASPNGSQDNGSVEWPVILDRRWR